MIEKGIEKVRKNGKNSLKILHVRKNWLIGEIRFIKGGYRLYFIVDQNEEKYYVVDFEHKKKQQQIIQKLKAGLQKVFDKGIENILSLFT